MTDRLDRIEATLEQLTGKLDQLTDRVDSLTNNVDRLTDNVDQLTGRHDSFVYEVQRVLNRSTERLERVEASVESLVTMVARLT